MTDRQTILDSLERVRRRWRLRVTLEAAVKGAAIVVAAALLWAVLERLGLGTAVLVARYLIWTAVAVGFGVLAVRALRRRADDAAIALYLEEHEPALAQSVVSAVDVIRAEPALGSPVLVERLLAVARRGLETAEFGRRVERRRLRRAAGTLATVTLGSVAVLLLGPASLRMSAGSLFDPRHRPAIPEPFTVSVEPGNATVAKGGAQAVAAVLGGFSSETADLAFRSDSAGEWERIPMERDSLAGRFQSRLFDLNRATEYYVEADGVRSPVYRLDVVDLPAVRRLEATIRYPAYTGLPPETIEDAGDLTVMKGATVTIRAMTTRPARSASLVVLDGAPVSMEPGQGGSFGGTFRATSDGFYRIDLVAEDGRAVRGSLEYAIDVLEDSPPTVRVAAPGRDTKVTSVEEVMTRLEAGDDYGVRSLRLHVSVNGGPDRVVSVVDSGAASRKEVSAGHTLFLEEWSLAPGDLVSYYAEATDGLGQAAKSDLYFLDVRPFDKAYRQAEQQGGGGGGGGGSPEGLSEQQRQVIVGTFNVLRDSTTQTDRAWRENLTTLAISQGRLREQVSELVGQMKQRNVAHLDSTFQQIATELDSAQQVMQRAEEGLGKQQPRVAMPDEQRALRHLQRAEAAYRETQIAQGGGGGGGGGGGQANAEELADLFELETDKLKNQYESVQQEASRQSESQLDETLEKLRRLASRQQQENERMERMADALRNRSSRGGGGGGAAQRDLAGETEEAARQLERLARERNDPSLAETARQLRDAAESMRRAASGAGARGNDALDRLKNATRGLERARQAGRQEQIRALADRADQIRQRQREVGEQAARMPDDPAARRQRIDAVQSRKDALARDVDQLESEADRLARAVGKEQPKASRELSGTAEGLRTNRVRDKLLFSKGLVGRGSDEYLQKFEDQIGDNLAEASQQLRRAAGSLEDPAGSREAEALDRARDLVRGLESLRDRARAAQERGREGADAEQPAQGRDGRPGREPGDRTAPEGQPGSRPGQEGRAGREGQGERPGQDGQAGREGRGDRPGRDGQADRQEGAGRAGGQRAGPPGRDGQPQDGQGTGAMVPGQPDPAGRLNPGQIRQFVRDLRSRREVAESLRTDLRALGQGVDDIDRLIDRFRELENPATFGDVRGLDRLQEDLIEQLKNLEFALWRKFGVDEGQRPALGASARVPPKYRELVEEYYRSLARERPKSP